MKMRKSEADVRPNGVTKVHNVRFYNLTPRSIQVLALNKLSQKLALSRADGSIEIWDIQYAPCLEKTIVSSPGNSVEDLVWVGDRLLSAGLTGELIEWNLQTLQPLRKQFVTGNAIWCLAVSASGKDLAIGTEEGYINIFDLADGEMQYKHLFDKQEGRVLCCKFDASGEYLVTGSMGAIRIWNVASGHALEKMTVSRAEKHKEVIVWSLQVLSDFTIISGDSRGYVTVWDGRTAAQVEAHQVLKADVLTVAVNDEENMLMCSGIEPITRIYAKTLIRKEDMSYHRWVKFLQRSVHDHDVKALVCAGDRIISGGMDGYLGISSILKAKSVVAKYGPFLQNPCVCVAPVNNVILLRYKDYLEVWRLGSTSGKLDIAGNVEVDKEECKAPDDHRKWLAIDVGPEKLLELRSKRQEAIVCATISPNGQWICYSTTTELRLFRFLPAVADSNPTQLQRIKDLPEQFGSASHLQFTSDSQRLFVVHSLSRQILIFSMLSNGNNDIEFLECIDTGKFIKDTISLFAVSACGSYIAAASTDHTIAVWTIHQGKHFKHQLNLPRHTAATSALALHPQRTRLVVAFTDSKIFEYDFDEMSFTCSERDYFVPSAELHATTNIVLDGRNPDVFILQNDANFYVLEKCSPEDSTDIGGEAEADNKSLKKLKRVVHDPKVATLRLRMQKAYEHLIHLSWLSANELVAVGVNPISLIVQLPDAFKQAKFGST